MQDSNWLQKSKVEGTGTFWITKTRWKVHGCQAREYKALIAKVKKRSQVFGYAFSTTRRA